MADGVTAVSGAPVVCALDRGVQTCSGSASRDEASGPLGLGTLLETDDGGVWLVVRAEYG